jgi:hypothetical protein
MGEGTQVLTVAALYVGEAHGAPSVPVAELRLRVGHGVVGDRHAGPTRTRSTGEVVPNLRQFTAVSPEELGRAASAFGAPYIDPAWISANLCLTGPAAEALTSTLAPGTILRDARGEAILRVEGVTEPCLDAGRMIAARFPHLSLAAERFPRCALGHRGVHGTVLRDAAIAVGDALTLVPPAGRG